MNGWPKIISELRNLGFGSLLGGGAFAVIFWLVPDLISIELKTHDALFVGAIIGLGVDLFLRNTFLGRLLTSSINSLNVWLFYYIIRIALGADTARAIRSQASSEIQARFVSGGPHSARSIALLKEIDTDEIERLRADVDFVLDEVVDLDGRVSEIQQTLKRLDEK